MDSTTQTRLKIQNFPKQFSRLDKRDLLSFVGAQNVYVQPNFVIATFDNPFVAAEALRQLHQKEILGSRLRVTYFQSSQPAEVETSTPSEAPDSKEGLKELSGFVRKLFAINSTLGFDQPPLPYLKYRYPKANRAIVANIGRKLLESPTFYVQVLHLMNRMNLPPPFEESVDVAVVGTQTELSMIGEEESELESEEEVQKKVKEVIPPPVLKRKKAQKWINPVKKFLQAKPASVRKDPGPEVRPFEPVELVSNRKIVLQVPEVITIVESTPTHLMNPEPEEQVEPTRESEMTRKVLAENRLKSMDALPVFKNYSPGVKSNKLYIKNLAKTVTESDLRDIFALFSPLELEIKLMQSGRMKGQAFVTFKEALKPPDQEQPIDLALKETNGYMLKGKPMVVMYAKTQ